MDQQYTVNDIYRIYRLIRLKNFLIILEEVQKQLPNRNKTRHKSENSFSIRDIPIVICDDNTSFTDGRKVYIGEYAPDYSIMHEFGHLVRPSALYAMMYSKVLQTVFENEFISRCNIGRFLDKSLTQYLTTSASTAFYLLILQSLLVKYTNEIWETVKELPYSDELKKHIVKIESNGYFKYKCSTLEFKEDPGLTLRITLYEDSFNYDVNVKPDSPDYFITEVNSRLFLTISSSLVPGLKNTISSDNPVADVRLLLSKLKDTIYTERKKYSREWWDYHLVSIEKICSLIKDIPFRVKSMYKEGVNSCINFRELFNVIERVNNIVELLFDSEEKSSCKTLNKIKLIPVALNLIEDRIIDSEENCMRSPLLKQSLLKTIPLAETVLLSVNKKGNQGKETFEYVVRKFLLENILKQKRGEIKEEN